MQQQQQKDAKTTHTIQQQQQKENTDQCRHGFPIERFQSRFYFILILS